MVTMEAKGMDPPDVAKGGGQTSRLSAWGCPVEKVHEDQSIWACRLGNHTGLPMRGFLSASWQSFPGGIQS